MLLPPSTVNQRYTRWTKKAIAGLSSNASACPSARGRWTATCAAGASNRTSRCGGRSSSSGPGVPAPRPPAERRPAAGHRIRKGASRRPAAVREAARRAEVEHNQPRRSMLMKCDETLHPAGISEEHRHRRGHGRHHAGRLGAAEVRDTGRRQGRADREVAVALREARPGRDRRDRVQRVVPRATAAWPSSTASSASCARRSGSPTRPSRSTPSSFSRAGSPAGGRSAARTPGANVVTNTILGPRIAGQRNGDADGQRDHAVVLRREDAGLSAEGARGSRTS